MANLALKLCDDRAVLLQKFIIAYALLLVYLFLLPDDHFSFLSLLCLKLALLLNQIL